MSCFEHPEERLGLAGIQERLGLELDLQEFDLRDSIGDTLQTLGFRAAEKGLELAYQVQSNVPDCLIGDAGRIRQIIVNLVGNALKFTQEGQVQINVSTVPRSNTQQEIIFQVSDTGVGIPEGNQAALFEEFFQGEGSVIAKAEGAGLGLSLVRNLVSLMGGKVGVKSEVGRGSTFWFSIPVEI